MATLIVPVIFVPGITATCLNDEYLVSPEAVWTVLKKKYNRIALHPDNLKYELNEPARVRSGEIFGVAYDDLIDELRHNLSPRDEWPVPVYPFSYDWRMPLDMVEAELASFVQEVIERTKLMNHYHIAGYSKNPLVNLVGHSMGGMVISGYVERYKKQALVHKGGDPKSLQHG